MSTAEKFQGNLIQKKVNLRAIARWRIELPPPTLSREMADAEGPEEGIEEGRKGPKSEQEGQGQGESQGGAAPPTQSNDSLLSHRKCL